MKAFRHLLWLLFRLPSRVSSLGSEEGQQVLAAGEARKLPDPEGTVILGAGVIGLSTAYYLALSLNRRASDVDTPIFIVEPSDNVCPAASGQATGGLGDFGFDSSLVSLGKLSYRLHNELASNHNGAENYGFRDLNIFRITPNNFTGDFSPSNSWGPAPPVSKDISNLPDWIRASKDWDVHSLAGPPHAAHLDPQRFCQFLYSQCEELGVRFLFNSTALSLEQDNSRESFTSITVLTREASNDSIQKIPCNAVVIAAGPWSSQVFAQLFPSSQIEIQTNNTYSAGNHALIKIPQWEEVLDSRESANQVFLNNVVSSDDRLDITSFPGGLLYIGGWGAIPEELPDHADDVKAQEDQIKVMLELTRQYLPLESDEDIEIIEKGRCYRPVLMPNQPIITRVKWSLIGNDDCQVKEDPTTQSQSFGLAHSPVKSGLYINTGHGSSGITLGPGSGMIMRDLLLDRPPPIRIDAFDLFHDEEKIPYELTYNTLA